MAHPLLPLAQEFIAPPDLRCPTCQYGHLVKKQKFITHDDAATSVAKTQEPDAWEPDWSTGVFTGFLVCAHAGCGETVVLAGDYRVGDDPDPVKNGPWAAFYRLTYARPALTLVDCPVGTPESVVAAGRVAAEIVWIDPAGAAGRLRVAVEELLTAQRVPRFRMAAKPGKPIKRVRRTTHQRIELFAQRKPQVEQVLMAVKWIGNTGSHEGSLGIEDVLEGAEMLGLALRLLYDPSQPNLMRRVAAVNRHSGPAPRRRRV
ncbi:DUF4145 domain-containing protein [Microtetraspora malaysiensis]|uniref:DUF4145 domain-containing protein n=1 Tax=Microtetraspora malaysiensis TaxID=161358 RepID=UPI0012FC37FF|nr:DUF4145 domain-containing protein [Microtetraspora malaysiensis]